MKFTPLLPRMTRNAARCKACGVIVESVSRTDFRACACGKIAVDGGVEAPKRIGPAHLIEDLSEREAE